MTTTIATIRDRIKTQSIYELLHLDIVREVLIPQSGFLIYNSQFKNWQLNDPYPNVYKNGVAISSSSFTASNDGTTGLGKVTFTIANAASDIIEADFKFKLYTDTDIDNFVESACDDVGILLGITLDTSSLPDNNSRVLIELSALLRIVRDLKFRNFRVFDYKVGTTSFNKTDIMKNLKEIANDLSSRLTNLTSLWNMNGLTINANPPQLAYINQRFVLIEDYS